jgi:hypothetical protein
MSREYRNASRHCKVKNTAQSFLTLGIPNSRHFFTVNKLPIPVEKTLLKNFIFAKNRKDCEG